MPKVTFVSEKKEIEVPQGANLREEALKAGIQVYQGLARYLNCRGHATCGTCRVLVKKGLENLSPPGKLERFTLGRMMATIGHEEKDVQKDPSVGLMRLSCQCQVNGDCTIETKPAQNFSGENFWQKPYPNK